MSGSDDRARQLYEDHARTCAPDDFWGQVKRTVDGKGVGDDQIAMIVAAAGRFLALTSTDVVLDLCCGNGALTDRILDHCAGGHGVDASQHLISIAQRYFARPPHRTYEVADVVEFAASTGDTTRFTKAMCYGSFKYLGDEMARSLFKSLRFRFPNISHVYIGNNADKALKEKFFYKDAYRSGLEDSHDTFTGKWRTESDFSLLAAEAGWKASFHRMPPAFYAAHYCFDALLTPSDMAGT